MVNVATRFPIKSNNLLLVLLLVAHLLLGILAFYWFESLYKALIVTVTVLLSLFFSLKQYFLVTSSFDDLCWSGECWLMQEDSSNQIQYLDLMQTSWVTADFCLLKFASDSQEHAWLFTRRLLGERLYRELSYLVRSQLNSPSQQ